MILETDGKLMSGRDVAIAALLGAEEFGFATTALVCLGCMMMRVCNKDTCPFGIATQNAELRKRFKGKPEYVMNFMTFIAEELREIMAELGFRSVNEMVGRTDCLVQKEAVTKKARTVDLSVLLANLDPGSFMEGPIPDQAGHLHFMPEKIYDFRLDETLDEKVLLPAFEKNLGTGTPGEVSVKVSSTNRTFGTLLGSQIQRRLGNDLPDDTFTVRAEGGGGQSFGAFIPKGLTIRLSGDANDGFGKGLSGGKLVLTAPKNTGGGTFVPEDNIIVGNVALYGATSGKCYIDGIAGERFCIRNSGAVAVAWGCGDHGLEYMTGGRAVILGNTGKNFAAGMSGGIAYVLDRNHDLYLKLNKDMVELEEVTEKYDIQELSDILSDFAAETGSAGAKRILDHLEEELPYFKKIIPHDYNRMLAAVSHFEETGIPHETAELEAFRSVYAAEGK